MTRRSYMIIIVTVLVAGATGAWIAYRYQCSKLFAVAGPVTAPVAGQKTICFGFDAAPQADGVPTSWQSRVIKGKLQIELVDGPEPFRKKALHVICKESHFLLWNATSPYSPQAFPLLTWAWKVAVLPTDGDVRKHSPIPFLGENRSDATVQVLIGFEGNDVLSYIWDTTAPVGTEVEEPSPVATVRTKVIDSGPAHLNEWVTHTVNVYDDYRHRFGKSPGKVIGISIQTNSNHTSSTGDGTVSEITASGS